MKKIKFLFTTLVLTALFTQHLQCAPSTEEMKAQAAYNKAIPHYIEVCSMTQLVEVLKNGDKKEWGPFGHAVAFLHGVCLEGSNLRLCTMEELKDEQQDLLKNYNSGIGISVNALFGNINWIGIPGRDLFFHGNLEPDQVLNHSTYIDFVKHLIDSKIYQNVRIRSANQSKIPRGMSEEEYIIRNSIATDIGLTFGRDVYCSRLPLAPKVLNHLIDYLNYQNLQYADGKKEYVWHGVKNNCSHLIHNALAYALITSPKKTIEQTSSNALVAKLKLLQFLNPWNHSIPGNSTIRVAELGNELPIDNPFRAYYNHDLYQSLTSANFISTSFGAITQFYPKHQDHLNFEYDMGKSLQYVSVPFLWNKKKKFQKYFKDQRFIDLTSNLLFYRQKYAHILDQLKNYNPKKEKKILPWKRNQYDLFVKQLTHYIQKEKERLDNILDQDF